MVNRFGGLPRKRVDRLTDYLNMAIVVDCDIKQHSNKQTNEPGHEKQCLTSYVNNKGADQPVHPRSLIGSFVFAA